MEKWVYLNEIAEKVTTSSLADALDGMGLYGYVNHDLKPLSQKKRFFGQVYTVHWEPVRKSRDIKESQKSTWDQVRKFLVPKIRNGKGKVYVSGCGEILKEMALAGGMSCTFFSKIGFEGIVLGGAVRDAQIVKRSNIPVYGSNFTPMDTQGCFRVSSVGEDTVIGSQVVSTGSWVLADESGLVVVEDHAIEEALLRAFEVEQTEERMMNRIRLGEDLNNLILEEGGRI